MTSNRFIYLVLAAFITGTLLLIFIQYNSATNMEKLIKGNKKLLNELKAGNDLRELERDIISVESKIRATVATGDTSYIIGTDQQVADAEAYLDTLKMINEDTGSVKDINRLAYLARLKLKVRDQILDTFYHSGREAAAKLITNPRSKGVGNEINLVTRRIYDSRRRVLANLTNAIADNGRKARTWGSVLITLVLISAGGLFWFIISRISQQNLLIQRLDSSEKQVREAMRVKENFMANMSHEIRTPLNSVIGFAGLLKNRPLDPTSGEFVDTIEKAGNNLLAIINDILDLSKLEAGMMRLESHPFSIRELSHSIEVLFQEKAKEKNLVFHRNVEEQVPDILVGDATRLTQILVNLIGNALKFTEQGRVGLDIFVEGQQGDIVRLGVRVSDTGIGIARDKLDDIFDRFSQAEDSITRKFGGTGLGLAIVKDLIGLLKGEISVDSEPGKGTVFHFFIPYTVARDQEALPAAPALASSISASSESISASSDSISASSESAAPRVRLLVVDDNVMNRNLMRHLLESRFFSFDIVSNGREAIESLQQKKYDLVLMDIQMPEMDGYAASRHIRSVLRLDVPIIAMTAHAMAGEREKCLGSGMNEYLSKPIREQELFRMISLFTGPADEARPGGAPMRTETELRQVAEAEPGKVSYQYIDLGYLRQLSQGNRDFELSMTEQFLTDIPADLKAMEAAIAGQDFTTLNRVAHTMKTDVSIMGLTGKLEPLLDVLEFAKAAEAQTGEAQAGESQAGQASVQECFTTLKTICELALNEARGAV